MKSVYKTAMILLETKVLCIENDSEVYHGQIYPEDAISIGAFLGIQIELVYIY